MTRVFPEPGIRARFFMHCRGAGHPGGCWTPGGCGSLDFEYLHGAVHFSDRLVIALHRVGNFLHHCNELVAGNGRFTDNIGNLPEDETTSLMAPSTLREYSVCFPKGFNLVDGFHKVRGSLHGFLRADTLFFHRVRDGLYQFGRMVNVLVNFRNALPAV